MGNNMLTIIKKREKVMPKLLEQWDQYNEIKSDLAFGIDDIIPLEWTHEKTKITCSH